MIKQFPFNKRCFIIAEIGGNFINFKQAKKLIDAAASCGVDAIKLQTYRAETVSSREAMFDMENTGKVSQFELFKKYQIDADLHKKVFNYIDSKGLDWFSTPAHTTDVELLEKLGVKAYKIGSDDAVNFPFLHYVARIKKTIIYSTGMCTMDEVKEAVSVMVKAGNRKIVILHAVTSYPTHSEDVNLSAMQSLMRQFPEFPVGYSDHTIGTTACICAAAIGARVIEKHFTYDKNAEGPDHMLSASPEEMKEIVDKIREFEVMRGDGVKRPAKGEKITRINNRKSIVMMRAVKKGEKIKKTDIDIKRPGYGIQPKDFNTVIGKTAKKNLPEDHVLKWAELC